MKEIKTVFEVKSFIINGEQVDVEFTQEGRNTILVAYYVADWGKRRIDAVCVDRNSRDYYQQVYEFIDYLEECADEDLDALDEVYKIGEFLDELEENICCENCEHCDDCHECKKEEVD